jgi:YVTN family beta-propeller protein
VLVTPDGRHAYVANDGDATVSVIDTTTNTVTATVPTGTCPFGIAVTPDGSGVYVANECDGTVTSIATASNTVTGTVPIGADARPIGVAVTPDGAYAYVADSGGTTVTVIDTVTDAVTATVPVGTSPAAFGVFIIPAAASAPAPVPFQSFTARVEIKRWHSISRHGRDSFEVDARGVLGPASNGISPATEAVTLTLDSFSITIPAGSFVKDRSRNWDGDEDWRDHDRDGDDWGDDRDWRNGRDDHDWRHDDDDRVATYSFRGVINGVWVDAQIQVGPGRAFTFHIEGRNANLGLVTNPVAVGLTIGDDSGHTVVWADIDR